MRLNNLNKFFSGISRRKFFAIIAIMIILLSSIIYIYYFSSKSKALPPQQEPTLVSIESIKRIKLQHEFSFVGTLKSENAVHLASDTEGIIEAIHFQSGEHVVKDTLLVTLKHGDQEAAKEKAKAAYEDVSDQYRRALMLYKQKLLAETDMMQLKFKQKEAKADWNQAINAYNQRFIRAPFSGQLGIVQINLGEYVEAGQAIVNLHSMPVMFIDFSVPDSVGKDLKNGFLVTSQKPKISAEIAAIDSSLDADNRSLSIRARLLNPSDTMKPGSFVTVNLNINTDEKVLIIPNIAVDYTPYGSSVYIIDHDKAKLIYIQIKESQGDQFIIKSGLKEGDQVIVAGQNKLHDGALVKVDTNKKNS